MLTEDLNGINKNARKASRKASELLKLMKAAFPGASCTIEIIFWEDDTYCVRCKHAVEDEKLVLHMYQYCSVENENKYSRYNLDKKHMNFVVTGTSEV